MKTNAKLEDAQPAKPSTKNKLRENIEALIIAVILALFIRTFVVQAFKIPSGSMQETLLVGDYILVNKFINGIKMPFTDTTLIPITAPKRGDIIVFKFPNDPTKDFIKRVVGVGGDTVKIENKKVLVNDQEENNEFAVHTDSRIYPPGFQFRDNLGPITVPEGKLFVMGDNRDESNDSRFWGFVDISAVRGKAFIIYWSWDSEDFGVRWRRLGHMIY